MAGHPSDPEITPPKDAFAELKEELNSLQRALQDIAGADPRIVAGTPLVRVPALLAGIEKRERDFLIRYINAQGPHMEEAWKDEFIKVFDLRVDEGNPYRPVRAKT